MNTINQYNQVIESCRTIFLKKNSDYGTSWRMLRTISIVDQIYIKAWRIRQIQEKGHQKIDDGIDSEFRGIVNYGIIGLIQLELANQNDLELKVEKTQELYEKHIHQVQSLMMAKNHDYGEAWRNMTQESFVDLILTKLLRIKQILQNDGVTIISEGIDANYADIINYAVFALIKIAEQ